jgi:carbamoyltransferase
MSKILGISSGFHDAAVTLIDGEDILFASHSERYSKEKNDPFLNNDLINAALEHGQPDQIVFHEKDWAKRLRNIYGRNWRALREPSQKKWIKNFYPQLKGIPTKSYWHHQTHAASGVLTSEFDECAVMVIDAIGEFDTATIWHWKKGQLKQLHSVWFPSSLGLFYSAITHRVGLKPMEDEYILMGMAAYGDPVEGKRLSRQMGKDHFFFHHAWISNKQSLRGSGNLQRGLKKTMYEDYDDFTIAYAAQNQVEKRIMSYAEHARDVTGSENLVFMGGVALNCVANSRLFDLGYKNVHIMPNPGDAGSSLGAAALHLYDTTGKKVKWNGPYLGHNIEGPYPIKKALASLKKGEIFGIANGRAEFGPRALGNRSLCSDPRGPKVKDAMNVIKKRQKFRPFAPMILEKHVHEYFDMPGGITNAPYMQFVAKCKKPEEFPAIIHEDGTSRVQTVNHKQHPKLYKLLSEYNKVSGCPMLVNTSLNIKGQPIVNDVEDAEAFEKHYGVKVHTND